MTARLGGFRNVSGLEIAQFSRSKPKAAAKALEPIRMWGQLQPARRDTPMLTLAATQAGVILSTAA